MQEEYVRQGQKQRYFEMHHACKSLIFTVFFSLAAQAAHLTSADFSCQQQTSSCYAEILKQVAAEGVAVEGPSSSQYQAARLHGHGSVLRLQAQRTPIVFLMLHGLWATEKENNMLGDLLAKYGHFNVLQFTLPGHGIHSEITDKINYSDWITATQDAVKVAKLLGDKIVIGGHSTGAILSAEMILQKQDDFAGLYLIEPAFRVNPILTIGSCLGKSILKNLQKLAPIIGHLVDRPLPLKFGCEVGKMSHAFRHNLENLSGEIQVPTLIIQNVHDFVVSQKAIQNFAKYLAGDLVYLQFNQSRNFRHGQILDSPQEPYLASMFCQFLLKQQFTPTELQLYCSALPQP